MLGAGPTKSVLHRTATILAVFMLAPFAGCGIQPLPTDNLIDFSSAQIVAGTKPGSFELVVQGTTPTPCYDVSLQPLVYIAQPDYWGIQVSATQKPGLCAQVITPFEVRLALDSFAGTKGVEVIGATKSQQLDVPPP